MIIYFFIEGVFGRALHFHCLVTLRWWQSAHALHYFCHIKLITQLWALDTIDNMVCFITFYKSEFWNWCQIWLYKLTTHRALAPHQRERFSLFYHRRECIVSLLSCKMSYYYSLSEDTCALSSTMRSKRVSWNNKHGFQEMFYLKSLLNEEKGWKKSPHCSFWTWVFFSWFFVLTVSTIFQAVYFTSGDVLQVHLCLTFPSMFSCSGFTFYRKIKKDILKKIFYRKIKSFYLILIK